MISARIQQSGNRVELGYGNDRVVYDVEGEEMPPLNDHSFALWHLLPHAMATGQDIHIHGRVDPVVLSNAKRMARTWAMWQPGKMHRSSITADEIVVPTPSPENRTATFFSGGVDSTHMLIATGRLPKQGTAVTVHGMDYDLDAHAQFAELLSSTDGLLEQLNYRRIVIRSNASQIVRGSHAWAMAIAGHAWLLSAMFQSAEMAADFTLEQDMLTFPWASNAVTNRYFQGSAFELEARGECVSRTQKVEILASNEIALRSSTFCKKKNLRPKNCGTCQKCLRTKAMFLVTGGLIPDIFIEQEFNESHWSQIDLANRIERAFFLDMYETAQERGLKPVGLEKAYQRAFGQPVTLKSTIRSIGKALGVRR